MGSDELVERLRDADRNSVQRMNGSRIFGEAADRIEALTAQLAEARESERAAVERSVKLWALLDDIDTLDDTCRGHDDLFRTLTRAAQQERYAIMTGEEWDAARQTGEPA